MLVSSFPSCWERLSESRYAVRRDTSLSPVSDRDIAFASLVFFFLPTQLSQPRLASPPYCSLETYRNSPFAMRDSESRVIRTSSSPPGFGEAFLPVRFQIVGIWRPRFASPSNGTPDYCTFPVCFPRLLPSPTPPLSPTPPRPCVTDLQTWVPRNVTRCDHVL